MKQIVFEGYLHDMYPDGIAVEGDSAAECISALALYPGFRPSDGVLHSVQLPDFLSRDALFGKTSREVVRVVPMATGAGGRGMGQIILGAILIGLTIWNPLGLFVGQFAAFSASGAIGAAMMVSGIVQTLMPAPKSSDLSQEERSKYLAAGKNTTRVGTRIPLLLGRRKVGGHFLAFNVTATNMPAAVAATAPSGGYAAYVDELYYEHPGGF